MWVCSIVARGCKRRLRGRNSTIDAGDLQPGYALPSSYSQISFLDTLDVTVIGVLLVMVFLPAFLQTNETACGVDPVDQEKGDCDPRMHQKLAENGPSWMPPGSN